MHGPKKQQKKKKKKKGLLQKINNRITLLSNDPRKELEIKQ